LNSILIGISAINLGQPLKRENGQSIANANRLQPIRLAKVVLCATCSETEKSVALFVGGPLWPAKPFFTHIASTTRGLRCAIPDYKFI
jgi:hypothetical protein